MNGKWGYVMLETTVPRDMSGVSDKGGGGWQKPRRKWAYTRNARTRRPEKKKHEFTLPVSKRASERRKRKRYTLGTRALVEARSGKAATKTY